MSTDPPTTEEPTTPPEEPAGGEPETTGTVSDIWDQLKPKMTVHEAISAVMNDISAVAKERRNVSQNYNFRGIDDFLNAAHPVMARHGLTIVPRKMRHEMHIRDRVSNDGKIGITVHIILTVTWRATGPDGSHADLQSIGEAADTADKATNKAMSAAEKYMLISVFKIPTADIAEGDSEHPDMGSRGSAQRPPQAPRPAADAEAKKPTKTQIDNIGVLANEVIGTNAAEIKAVMMAITERVAVRSHMTFDEAVKVISTLGKIKAGELVLLQSPAGVKIYPKGEEPFSEPETPPDTPPDTSPGPDQADADAGNGYE